MQCDVHRVSTSQCRVLAPAEHAISGIIAVALAGAMVDNAAVLRDVIASVLLASLATSGGGGIVIGHPPNDCPLRPREFIISWWFGTPPPRSRRDSGHLGGGAKARLPLLITHPPTEIPLSHLRICIEDAYGLRRITAAPCPFGSAYVAESWARACPNYQTMCSPRRCGKPSGNTWGRKRRRRRIRKKEEEKQEGRSRGPLARPAGLSLPRLLSSGWFAPSPPHAMAAQARAGRGAERSSAAAPWGAEAGPAAACAAAAAAASIAASAG